MDYKDYKKVSALRDFFKVLGDDTRVRIILLLRDNPQNVTEIATALNMEQSAISHQLRTLYLQRAVNFHRNGKEKIYEIRDNHIYEILASANEHIEE